MRSLLLLLGCALGCGLNPLGEEPQNAAPAGCARSTGQDAACAGGLAHSCCGSCSVADGSSDGLAFVCTRAPTSGCSAVICAGNHCRCIPEQQCGDRCARAAAGLFCCK